MKSLCSMLFVLCFSVALVGCNKEAADTTPKPEAAKPADGAAADPAADPAAAEDKGTEPESGTSN